MTLAEKMDFKIYFPLLDVDKSQVTAPETPTYNCISWTTGNTQSWDWPPRMYEGTPVECFQQYYKDRGFTEITPEQAATIGKDKELVAYWEDPNGPTHGSVSGPSHFDRWESKCGQAARITHDRDELESQVYGKIKSYWLKTAESNIVEFPLNQRVKEQINQKLDLRLALVSPKTREAFETAYQDWQQERRQPKIAMSSDPAAYLPGDGYEKLKDLGPEAMPLWMQKMSKGDFFCHYAVEELSRDKQGGFEIKGLTSKPSLAPRELRCSEQDKANQVMQSWLNSSW